MTKHEPTPVIGTDAATEPTSTSQPTDATGDGGSYYDDDHSGTWRA